MYTNTMWTYVYNSYLIITNIRIKQRLFNNYYSQLNDAYNVLILMSPAYN